MKPGSIRLTIIALSLLGFFGCGPRAAVAPSAVAPDAGGDSGAVQGRRSFDVTALLASSNMLAPNLPASRAFTIVLDPGSGRAIVGGNGRAAIVPVTSSDGRAFHFTTTFSVGDTVSACASGTELDFEALDVTVSGATLQGTGSGQAQVSCGDCMFAVPFTATLAGADDATPPLLLPSGAIPATPFDAFAFIASEPLPATATARLTFSDGSHVELLPDIADGAIPLVTGFSKPDQVLPVGGVGVTFEGLVDFAGLRGASDVTLRLAAFGAAPLVPEDGFESATDPQIGGAGVIVAGVGALPPIAGARSVYIGGGTPSPDGNAVRASLRVRLAVQPGDTKVRFSYRVVSQTQGAGFGGVIHVGSVGHESASASVEGGGQGGTEALWPVGQSVFVEDVGAQELVLPADVTDEIVVDLESANLGCGLVKPVPSGLLIDDLRVE